MRVYRLEHEVLPETLDVLVPDFIDQVPIDPFSAEKKPLNYSRKNREIWSVGAEDPLHVHRPEELVVRIPPSW